MIYVYLADGFEEVEAITPVDFLRRAGSDVITVSVSERKYVTGSHGIKLEADTTLKDASLTTELEMIVLPGGKAGVENLDAEPEIHRALRYCAERKIPIAAICAAPSIPGKLGMLDGLEAISYPSFTGSLKGAKLSSKKTVTDGIFTTSAGMGVSREFSIELIRRLHGDAAAKKISDSVIA